MAISGDRKTTADNEATWPIRKREAALSEIFCEQHARWVVDNAAWAAEKKKIEGDRKIDYEKRRALLEQLGPAPAVPLHPLLTAPDPTIEGLVKAWVTAPASLGLFSAEGGQFIGGYGISQDHRLKTAAALSEMWEAKTIKRIRATDGVTILRGRRLSMHMLVQPEASAAFFSDPILRGQGLLSRVLVAAPDSIARTRLYRETDADDDAAIRAFGARILEILEKPWPLAERTLNELAPPQLKIASDATKPWVDFYDCVEQRSRLDGELAAIGDFAAKVAEHAARIAGVLSIFHNPAASEIDAGAMGNAIVLADWYLNEALRLQRAARTDPRLLRAQRLLDWLQERGLEMPVREIMQFGPASCHSKAAADKALAILRSHRWGASAFEATLPNCSGSSRVKRSNCSTVARLLDKNATNHGQKKGLQGFLIGMLLHLLRLRQFVIRKGSLLRCYGCYDFLGGPTAVSAALPPFPRSRNRSQPNKNCGARPLFFRQPSGLLPPSRCSKRRIVSASLASWPGLAYNLATYWQQERKINARRCRATRGQKPRPSGAEIHR